MSESESQGGAGRREVAWRAFAAEYDDAILEHSESDEERAPNYVVTPTGARINRLFVAGVLTQVEQVSDDVLRGRVVDPTGAFVLYAGQYQPDEMAFLENADPPMFVAVTGKARTFRPDDSDQVFTSIRPESINEVDADTRDRWVVQTAEQTLARVSTLADALDADHPGDDLRETLEASGVDASLAAGIPLAIDHYGTTKQYLADVWDLAVDATRVVAGEIDADDVGPLSHAPSEGGDDVSVDLDYALPEAEAGDLAEIETEAEAPSEADEPEPAEATEPTETDEPTEAPESAAEPETTAGDDLGEAPTSSVGESEAEADAGAETDIEAEADAEAETGSAPGVEDAEDAAERREEVGDDELPTVESEPDTSTDEEFAPETDGQDDGPDLGTAGAGDEMYEFDEEEREEVEEEYGLEFSSGTEVDSPDESDLEPPEPEAELGDAESDAAAEQTTEESDTGELRDAEPAADAVAGSGAAEDETAESETAEDEAETDEIETDADETAAEPSEPDEQAEPENLEDAVMDAMRDRNEGDGVEREALLAAVVQEYDATPVDVEDALEAALMAGRCYESGEDALKPI